MESGGHVSPVDANERPDPTAGMNEKELKKHIAEKKRKERNRIAQQRARERQRDMIRTLSEVYLFQEKKLICSGTGPFEENSREA